MELYLSSSSSSESDDDTVELSFDRNRPATAVGTAASEFARRAISEGEQNLRVTSPLQYARVDVDGASARIVPLVEDHMRGLHLIDVTLAQAFAEPGHRRLLFLRLQQELLGHFPTRERICFVRVSDPILSLRVVMERLYGWRLTDEESADGANAPRRRFWTWHHPAHALFHARGVPVAHTLSAVEELFTGKTSYDLVSYAPVDGLEVHVRMDAFIRPPVEQAQRLWDDDTESSTPLHIRNPVSFGIFFARVVAHCRALGNLELERGSDLMVVSIDHFAWDGAADRRHVRALFAFIVAFARIFVRPLFIRRDVLSALTEAAGGNLFALVEEASRPQLDPVTNEDYVVWVPHHLPRLPDDDSQPLVVEVSEDDDEDEEEEDDEPDRKRARRTFTCAQCRRQGAQFRAPLPPMCSRQCVRDFYGIH